MITLNSYLSFDGTCEAAFDFYKSIFGGKFSFVGRYKDLPPAVANVPDAFREKIMHIVYRINEKFMLMGADSMIVFGHRPTPGDNNSLSLYFENADEARRVFDLLSKGGRIAMPLDKTFWAELFGMVTDKYGISWMVTYGEQVA